MITQTLLEQSLQENAPHLLMEEIQTATWLHPQPPLMSQDVFVQYEQQLLEKGLNEKSPSWWKIIWEMEPPTSWRTTLSKLLINCGVRYSINPQWLEMWGKEHQTPQEAYQLAYQCVVENNIKWLNILCRQPLLRSHPHLYNRLFKDSVRKKCPQAFSFLYDHIQDRTNPQTVGAVLQECIQQNFLGGVQHIIKTTTKKLLKETYKSIEDFKSLRVTKNCMDNDSFVFALTEGRLQDSVSKDVWLKVSKEHLQNIFVLYTSDIFVFRLSPRVLPSVEEVLFSHKYWNNQRMEWMVKTLHSAPSSTHLSPVGNSMKEKWVKMLLPLTTTQERKKWLDDNQHLRSSSALSMLFKHPLMQETVLRLELQDVLETKQETAPRKI